MHKGMMCLVKERLKDCRTSTTDYGGEHVERRVCKGRREGGREKGKGDMFYVFTSNSYNVFVL